MPSLRQDADERLKELILYIADRCEQHPKFGATKLNKILFYADFIAYARLGEPITGCEYQRLRYGPAPRRLKPVEKDMIDNEEAVLRTKTVHTLVQKRLVPLRDSDLDMFTAHEIAIVDEVIETLRSRTAEAVSELSHEFSGWKLADNGEVIPYHSVLIPPEDWQPDEETLAEGAKLAAIL